MPVFLFVLPGLICYVLITQGRLDEKRFPEVKVGRQVEVDGQTVYVPDIMAPGGRYVTGASHDTILEETPVGNVLAMFDAVEQFGQSPDNNA